MNKKILFVVILYLFFFNPLFSFLGGMGSIKLLYPLVIFYFFQYRTRMSLYLSTFKAEKSFFIFLLLYSLCRSLIGGEFVETYKHIILFVENFFIPIVLIEYANKHFNVIRENMLTYVMITGCVAASISTLCVVSPVVQEFVKFKLQVINSNDFLFDVEYRGYGLCEALTYSLGIIEGMIMGFGIINIKNYKWFLIAIPFFIVTIMLNARTGIIIAATSIISYLLFGGRDIRKWITVALGSLVVFFIISETANYFSLSDEQQFFVNDFFKQVTEAEEDGATNQVGAIGSLTTNHLVMPEGVEWIVGKGYEIVGRKGIKNSDIGFIQQLNYGGLLYMLIMIGWWWFMFRRLRKVKMPLDMILFLLTSFIISNYKGNFVMNSGGFRLFVFLYYSYVFLYYQEIKKNMKRSTI